MQKQTSNEIINHSSDGFSPNAFIWTWIAIASFVVMFISIGLLEKWQGIKYVLTYSAVLSHLSLLPVVAALHAPPWAKVGGYTWAVFDTILVVASLHGVSDSIASPLRLGLHVVAAVWPLGVALTSNGFIRWAGYALAITIGIIPLLGSLVPPYTVFIVMPFIFIWLGTIAWKLRKN